MQFSLYKFSSAIHHLIYLGVFLVGYGFTFPSIAQSAKTGTIKGNVTTADGKPAAYVNMGLKNANLGANTDESGNFVIRKVGAGSYLLVASIIGFAPQEKPMEVKSGETTVVNFSLSESAQQLNEVLVTGVRAITGMGYLGETHNGAIYSGKKTEVLLLDSLDANTAQNNPRQVLGRVPGANYSETEGSGFPSNGIGFRGLNPTQSVEMNTRQNGYNVTADIYGYPEAYYLPPLEAVERIEVIRGASSLQFGPQFGGVINYIIKQGNKKKAIELTTQQTGGSYGLLNSFTSVGGKRGRFNYYAFVQYKGAQGWRPNSHFQQVTGFGKVEYQATDKLTLGLQYSLLRNRIQMPGGLTDEQFAQNSRASYRSRNWLESPWNILTATLEYKFSPNTTLTIQSAGLLSGRNLVWRNEDGGPGASDDIDPMTKQYVNREVGREKFTNSTTEARLLAHYQLGRVENTLAAGIRFYAGKMHRQGGGQGTTGSDFDLTLLNPHYGYDLHFTTTNFAPFIENTFRLTDRLSITPGFRFEYIRSTSKGYLTTEEEELQVDNARNRYFVLFGLGAQYKTSSATNLYANMSQAYRPIDYSLLTPFGVTSRIDPNMKDAKGYNVDFGWRGSVQNFLHFDVGGFYLQYNNRIGLVELTEANGDHYTLRTNVANSVHRGAETYVEVSLTKLLAPQAGFGDFSFFNSFAYIDAKYVTGEFKGKQVEYAPQTINRLGITYALKRFSTTFVWSETGKSFGDANNTVASEDAIIGVIPAYQVMDWSTTYRFSRFNLKLGVNNLANARYFTKRTDEYPGPGIIPSTGRSFYFGIGAKF